MERDIVIIKRVREVKMPTKAYEDAAGFDFYIPDSFAILPGVAEEEKIAKHATFQFTTLPPGGSIFIPSGIIVKMHPDWFMKFENKSGWAKKGLMVGCTIVDPDYQGEVHINLWNVGHDTITLKAGEKIVQAIFYHKPNIKIHEIERREELFASSSQRGAQGFGSSQGLH